MAIIGAGSSLGGFSGGNALARLLVVISGDTSQLDAALAKASGSAASFGQNAGAIGSALTRTVTLPILALGGAALYMATQFQSGLARISGLTPLLEDTGQSIGQVSDALLDLAQEVPTSPNDLAESLYLAGSAGLVAAKGSIEASEAFQVVELSAKGAAIGMGQSADISKVLIAAMNNYRASGLTAASAMDVLTAGIREGTAAPEEMAIALGRLLPIARQAGITFADTVASVAALTNLGVPTRVATTSLRALFSELLMPTQQATERLAALGLTTDQLRDSLANLGPVGAFDLISKAVHGDEDALRDIIPQIRGMTAFIGLSTAQMKPYLEVLDNVRHSLGDFGEAFKKIQETPGFKFEIALNKLRVAAIKTGAAIFPIFEKIIQVIGDVADSFANMSDTVRNIVVAFAAVAASIGPLLKLLANMGAFSGTLIKGYKQVGTTFTVLAASIFILMGSFQSLMEGSTSLSSSLTTVVAGAAATFAALRLLQGAALAGAFGATRFGEALIGLSTGGLAVAAITVGALVAVIGLAIGSAQHFENVMVDAANSMVEAARSGATLRQALTQIADEGIRTQLQGVASDLDLLGKSAGRNLDELAVGAASRFTTSLNQVIAVSREAGVSVRTDLLAQLEAVAPALLEAARNGDSLTSALSGTGISGTSGLLDLLNNLRATSGGAREDVEAAITALMGDTEGLSTAIRVLNQFDTATQDSIDLTVAGEAQIQEFARRTGVSIETVTESMSKYGLVAGTVSEQTFQDWQRAVEGPDKVAMRIQELQAEIVKAADAINSSIESAFQGFDKPIKKLGPDAGKLLENLRANVAATVQEVANLKDLASRGVNADVLGFLADQGPGAVQRFASASEGELVKLQALYEVHLAAIDNSILAEALHQEDKAKNMVAGFAEAMLSNSSLPPQAAADIVRETVDKFTAGNIDNKGLAIAIQFARGFGKVKNLSGKEAADAMNFIIAELQKKDLSAIGHEQAVSLARGLSSATGLSRAAANRLIDSINIDQGADEAATAGSDLGNRYAAAIRGKEEDAHTSGKGVAHGATTGLSSGKAGAASAGTGVVNAFNTSIAIGAPAAYLAAWAVSQAANQGFIDGSKGSPKYATYYLGQDLVDQLNEGMRTRKFEMPFDLNQELNRGLSPVGSPNHGRISGGDRHRRDKFDFDLDVTLDRTRAAKALDWEASVRGN